jgi:hypothetical protein
MFPTPPVLKTVPVMKAFKKRETFTGLKVYEHKSYNVKDVSVIN